MMSGTVIGTTVQSPRVLLVLYNHNYRNSHTKEKYQSWVLCIKRGFQYSVCQWLHAQFPGFCRVIPVPGIGLRPKMNLSDCGRVRSIPQLSRKILRYPGQYRSPIYYVKRNDSNAVCSSLHYRFFRWHLTIDSPFTVFCRTNTCVDINECATNNHKGDCDQICENTPGSYKCSCRDGYKLRHEKRCLDIDECTIGADNCQHNCTNINGRYLIRRLALQDN